MALINYTGKNILGIGLKAGGMVRLLPGINEIVGDNLEQIKAHPLFQARVKKGMITVMADNMGKDGKRTVEDMLTAIPKIVDVKLLRKIVDTDGRDPVVKAAQYQLDLIKNPAKARAEKEDDGDHFK